MSRRKRLAVLMMACILLFTGCGNAQEETVINEEKEYVDITEVHISGADDVLITKHGEEGTLARKDYKLGGGGVYRTPVIYDQDYSWLGRYLQRLEAPYTEWITEDIMRMLFEQNGKTYGLNAIFYGGNGNFYCSVSGPDAEGWYLAAYEQGGMGEIIAAIPEELTQAEYAVDSQGRAYAYETHDRKVTALGMTPEEAVEKSFVGTICGVIENPVNHKVYVYGYGVNDNMCVWDMADGVDLLQGKGEQITYYLYADFAPDGTLYLADSRGIWEYKEELATYCTYFEEDYYVESIYGMEVSGDGKVQVLATVEGSLTLLTLEKKIGQVREKQEIVISFIENHIGLNRLISRFNRQSKEYHITVQIPGTNESWSDYRARILMEVSAGRGPDIMGNDFLLYLSDYVDNGYLVSLEDVIEDESPYLSAAIEGGKIDGTLYGIPYDCQFTFVVYPKSLVGERSRLTMEELMELVEASEAEILQSGCTAFDIVYHYGLFDNDNPAYIDWEKGESHLDEEPFVKLLEFAKRYGDVEESYNQDLGLIADGKAVAYKVDMFELQELHGLEVYVGGKPAVLGYPRQEGNGVYLRGRYLYLNANSAVKEGAKEFFRFILSEEQQKIYVDYKEELPTMGSGLIGWRPQLPVHLAAYERLVETQYRENLTRVTAEGDTIYQEGVLNEQEEAYLYDILEKAQPDDWKVLSVGDILAEELAPYFKGAKTAEEVARIVDDRVQLYLDENVK